MEQIDPQRLIDPGQCTDERIFQRHAAAVHEAGHAVVARCCFGWEINCEGMEIDDRQYTGLRFTKQQFSLRARVMVLLAGWASEHRWHRRGTSYSDDELRGYLIEAAQRRCISGHDIWDAMQSMEMGMRHAENEAIIAQYRQYEQELALVLDKLWDKILGVANALVKKGRISDADVDAILGRPPAPDRAADSGPTWRRS